MNEIKKKKLIAIGDSITKGTYTGKNDLRPASIAKPNFTEIVSKYFDFEYINYAMNGIAISSLSPQATEWAICNQVDTYDAADVVIISAGTNDWGACVPFGSPKDKTDISFYGALYFLYSKIRQKNKNAKVFVITPILRAGESQNRQGNSLQDYREIIKSRANEFDFIVINGEKIPINPENEQDKQAYILDGTHPNTEGHALYANYVLQVMKEYLTK